jgi:hypothetical protein
MKKQEYSVISHYPATAEGKAELGALVAKTYIEIVANLLHSGKGKVQSEICDLSRQ